MGSWIGSWMAWHGVRGSCVCVSVLIGGFTRGVHGRWGPERFRGSSVAVSDLLVVSSACVVSGLRLVWLLFIGYRQGGVCGVRAFGMREGQIDSAVCGWVA